MELKFYICPHCGNIAVKVEDKKVPLVCCGQPMKELVAGTSDGAAEKHVPVYSVENGVVSVSVGEVEHPMLAEHHIRWVVVQTKTGWQIKYLEPGTKPEVKFAIAEGDEVVAVYEYCNLHSLFKA